MPEAAIAAESCLHTACFWCERIHPAEHPLSVCVTCAHRYGTFRSLEMCGPYALDDATIDAALTETAPGNYALGYLNGEEFDVFYVGRSDFDVKRRLHDWVGMPSGHEKHASSAKAPWELHRMGPLPIEAPGPGPVGNGETSYTRFAFSYADSAEDAYAREWRNYDAFGGRNGLDNDTHPSAAPGASHDAGR